MNELAFALNQTPFLRSMDLCTARAPFVHQSRVLDYHVLVYVVSGEIPVREAGEEYVVREHDAAFLKAGLHHWGEREAPAGTRWYYVHFYLPQADPDLEELTRYSRFVRNQEFTPEDYCYRVTLPKQVHLRQNNGVQPALSELLAVYRSSGLDRGARASHMLQNLLLTISRLGMEQRPGTRQDVIADRLVRYLEERLAGPVRSGQIAEYMQMNYQYLCEVFKEKTGLSIQSYHTRLRISESARLLREGTVNVSQAAQAVGFSDPLYFSGVFKKVVGIPPSEYMKQTCDGDGIRIR